MYMYMTSNRFETYGIALPVPELLGNDTQQQRNRPIVKKCKTVERRKAENNRRSPTADSHVVSEQLMRSEAVSV